MSNSVRPHRQKPSRLPHPWDSPGKNTGVCFHFLLQCMKVKTESEVAQSCLTLCNPIQQPTRLLHPCDFPGKSTGVGCHCLLCSTLCIYLNWNILFFSLLGKFYQDSFVLFTQVVKSYLPHFYSSIVTLIFITINTTLSKNYPYPIFL